MKKILKKFNRTPLGSFTKVFLFSMMVFAGDAYISDTLTVGKEFLKALIKAGVIGALPAFYNWLNPNYEGYGLRKIENLEADRKV